MKTMVLSAALMASIAVPLAAQQSIRGIAADALATQRRLETQLRAVPNADSLRARMRLLSEEPHEAGTDRSRKVAELILQKFRAAGLDARIEIAEALMPRPTMRALELIAPEKFTARLAEPVIAEDKDSGDKDQLPTYNAYSADGDVTGELVYVNYGIPEDYKVLDSLGISVRGKIVIARYGRSWRGIKPKVAAERGAIGCIIYSDPREDGYFEGDVYPKGPMRNEFGVQRGSVMDMPTYPGDPLSPGWGSEPGARKLALSEAKTLMTIPVLPISYSDALPLLRHLGGPVAPQSWRGALPITYHIGGGPARVRLALKFDWQSRPIYNVVARIPGSTFPDQWVLHGNHHDAWVNGADDPISGMVALEETARSLGALLKTGWRPQRTIVLIGWDAEEWGLLGSTEWAEKWAAELGAKAVAYLNSDSNNRGWLDAAGSHSLETFVREVARDIQDPQRGVSVLDAAIKRRRDRAPAEPAVVTAARPDSAKRDSSAKDTTDVTPPFTIGALGSGSDYTAFIDHLGLASLNLSYGGEANDGIYHSIYDTFDHYRRFSDTTFKFGVAESQTLGTAILRLSEARVLPFEFGAVVRTYRGYVEDLHKQAHRSDSLRPLDLGAIRKSLDRLARASTRYEIARARVEALPAATVNRKRADLERLNRTLYLTERALTDSAGLPGRPWFRHLIYAPGFYTGYGVKTMPGVREAVEDKPNLALAQAQAARIAAALDRYAQRVEEATAIAEGIR